MQRNHTTFTVNNLLSIFNTSRTVLYQHINQNGLKSELINNGHLKPRYVTHNNTIFDDIALVKIAKTFKNRNVKKPRKRANRNNMSKHTERELLSLTKQNTRQLDKISNKLGVTF